MDVHVGESRSRDVRDYVERTFRPLARRRGSSSTIEIVGANVPPTIETDEQRLQQILKNLLSNAFKFTETGGVALRIEPRRTASRYASAPLERADAVVAFAVDRHRDRHPARQAAADLRGVPAGRRDDEPPLRRHRARALDQPRDRAAARRRDPGRVERRRGQHVHALPAATYRRRRASTRRAELDATLALPRDGGNGGACNGPSRDGARPDRCSLPTRGARRP